MVRGNLIEAFDLFHKYIGAESLSWMYFLPVFGLAQLCLSHVIFISRVTLVRLAPLDSIKDIDSNIWLSVDHKFLMLLESPKMLLEHLFLLVLFTKETHPFILTHIFLVAPILDHVAIIAEEQAALR